jgi:hypothetical protein
MQLTLVIYFHQIPQLVKRDSKEIAMAGTILYRSVGSSGACICHPWRGITGLLSRIVELNVV